MANPLTLCLRRGLRRRLHADCLAVPATLRQANNRSVSGQRATLQLLAIERFSLRGGLLACVSHAALDGVMYVHNLLLALYSAAVTIFMVRHAAFVRIFPAAPVCAKYCVVFVWLSVWFSV